MSVAMPTSLTLATKLPAVHGECALECMSNQPLHPPARVAGTARTRARLPLPCSPSTWRPLGRVGHGLGTAHGHA